jgi:hypothetical protein
MGLLGLLFLVKNFLVVLLDLLGLVDRLLP